MTNRLALAICLALTACGPDPIPTDPEQPEDTSEPAPVDAPPPDLPAETDAACNGVDCDVPCLELCTELVLSCVDGECT